MLAFVQMNLATVLISVGLLAVVAVVVAVMIRDKRRGRSACGCSCANCPAACGKK